MILCLVALVCAQRLWELKLAASNVSHLRRLGAVEYGAEHYPCMVLLHSFWLFSIVAEWYHGTTTLPPTVITAGWLALILGQCLRWHAIRTLGPRWTTRILVLPGEPLVKKGLFRWVPHPNYVGVGLEIFGLPLIGSCWKTSVVFGFLNLLLLRYRIQVEDAALAER